MKVQRVVVLAVLFAVGASVAMLRAEEKQKSEQKVEEGFTPLFNGKDLTGWKFGSEHPKDDKSHGFYAEDGILVCDKTATYNLYTEKDYDNFVLRFDFKLRRDGNNGIGIHAPTTGNIAYDGIEIQILDDDGPMYKGKIQPWQHHGSVYGCVAAKSGSLKEPGEWNSEEIVVDGRHIKVMVNDKVIVDADLDKDVTDPEVLKKHPGLKRTTGKIALLGHTDRTDFRNIRVKELESKTKTEDTNK
jgi:hypothetical protein